VEDKDGEKEEKERGLASLSCPEKQMQHYSSHRESHELFGSRRGKEGLFPVVRRGREKIQVGQNYVPYMRNY